MVFGAKLCRMTRKVLKLNMGDYTDDVVRSVGFLSLIPVPGRHFNGFDGRLSRAIRAFPVAGVLISLPGAAVFAIALAFGVDALFAAFIALGLQILLTGCLHEDGLSDTVDGLGGGKTRQAALDIMRDSRIGSYGAVALIVSLGIRASAMGAIGSGLSSTEAGLVLLGIAALSRSLMVWHWQLLSPARAEGVAASVGEPEQSAAMMALFTGGVLCAVLLLPSISLLAIIITILLAAFLTSLYTGLVQRKIGGHTGDTIGAAQQIAEMAALGALAILY